MARKALNTQEPKKDCVICHQEYPLKNGFYNTTDIDFFPDGKINTCKKCCAKMLEEKGFAGFQSLMRVINKPIYNELYDGDVGKYIRIVNSNKQYKDKTFLESDLFFEIRNEPKLTPLGEDLSADDIVELEHMFGEGYDAKDYAYMKYEFEDYCNKYEVDSKALEMLLREIVSTQLEIRRARASKTSTKDLQKTLQDLLGSANLKPVQETGANSVNQESFGTLIKKWENDRPIPEPSPEWKDVDGIRKYIETFFFGHLAKLFGREKENPLRDEYEETIGEHTVRPPREDD